MSDATCYTFAARADQFSVDTEKRTISGLVVPFGKKPIDGRDITFEKGDIEWSDASRVKANFDHIRSTSFGYGLSVVETDPGIVAKFKVPDGPRGDEALALALSGVYDGFSVSLYKPSGKDKFHLSHVALTAEPAFDEARVTKVAATAGANTNTEGARVMGDQTTETEAPAAQDFTPVTDAIKEGFAALNVAPRETVAAGDGVQTEAPLYRFDGRRGQHDFSTDLFAAIRHKSGESSQRLTEFFANLSENFAAVDSADVAGNNPNGYRPDLWRSPAAPKTPVADAIQVGGLTDGTPFIIPTFESSADLVKPHVEGNEPVDGNVQTDSMTVTPDAMSGQVKVTRKVIDAGGNPQTSAIIWNECLRQWDIAREKNAAALLNGATVAELGVAFAGTEADAALAAAIKAKLVSLAFSDYSFSVGLGHVDLYTALAEAVDGMDRPLFPILSPSNADGQATEKYDRLRVGGYDLTPAGSLGATGVGTKSFLLDPSGIAYWASAPTRIALPETVDTAGNVGLYGYHAGAVLDSDRILKMTY